MLNMVRRCASSYRAGRADKIFINERRVELLGKGGRVRRIHVLHAEVLGELDRAHRFVYLNGSDGTLWKDSLERIVRAGCDALNIRRRGIHGFRGTAAGEFVSLRKCFENGLIYWPAWKNSLDKPIRPT